MFKKRVKQQQLSGKALEIMNTRDIHGRLPSFIVINDDGEPEGMYGDKLTFTSDRQFPQSKCYAVSDEIIPGIPLTKIIKKGV